MPAASSSWAPAVASTHSPGGWRASLGVERVVVAPGNPGMTDVARGRARTSASDGPAIVALARAIEASTWSSSARRRRSWPAWPISLRAAGVAVFGPSAAAARLEGSKAFCREVATRRACRWRGGARSSDADRRRRSTPRRWPAGWWSRPTGWRRARASSCAARWTRRERAIRAVLVERRLRRRRPARRRRGGARGPEVSVIALCDETTALALARGARPQAAARR